MDNDWHECINIDQHLNIMTIKATISHFVSNSLVSFNAIVAVLYLSGEYVIRFVLSEHYNDTVWQLPIKLQFPFDTQHSPTFEFLVVILFLHVTIHASTIAVFNGLILTLVTYICIVYTDIHTYMNFLMIYYVTDLFVTQSLFVTS